MFLLNKIKTFFVCVLEEGFWGVSKQAFKAVSKQANNGVLKQAFHVLVKQTKICVWCLGRRTLGRF